MTKLFITGATGYIGGDVLAAIASTYPDLEITALVRNSDKGAQVAAQFPKVRLVYGDLESTDLIASESSKSDIVVNTANCDHAGSAEAIIAGLAQSPKQTHLIHISGTGVLTYEDIGTKTFGVHRDGGFDDWDGIKKVTSIPDQALHRKVDKIVLAAHDAHPTVQTAIICPPTIYGPTRSPGNKRSIQVPELAKAILTRGKGFVINEGTNRWNQIHVKDLSDAFVALVTAALEGERSKATWNDEGYYFTENGTEFAWGDVSRRITAIAADKKLIKSKAVDALTTEQANEIHPWGAYLWGTNSRGKAIRFGKLLGWKPEEKDLFALLDETVEDEARELGLIKGHAAKAAGEA